MRMEMHVFTSVLPMSSVHSSKLPDSRMGRIFCALARSTSSPPSAITCRSVVSRPISPSVKPENTPESTMSRTSRTYSHQFMAGSLLGGPFNHIRDGPHAAIIG